MSLFTIISQLIQQLINSSVNHFVSHFIDIFIIQPLLTCTIINQLFMPFPSPFPSPFHHSKRKAQPHGRRVIRGAFIKAHRADEPRASGVVAVQQGPRPMRMGYTRLMMLI